MRPKLIYPKLYGEIVGITYKNMLDVVLLNNGVKVHIDIDAYCGSQRHRIKIGQRLKLFKRPQDRRPYVFKLTGE
jgi:hypothetical protein